MDEKQLAFLKISDPEKYEEHLAHQQRLKKMKYPKLASNMDYNGNYVARMYESGTNHKKYLVEGDGTHYQGKITQRKYYRRYKDECGRYKQGFWTYFYECQDGRWFDRSGWACDKPTEQRQPVDETIEE